MILSDDVDEVPRWATPRLTFHPRAWLKLQFLCHSGPTEVGGFGVSAPDNLLYVRDFMTVRQETTAVTVRFDSASVADFFDRCVDAGMQPSRFGRIWCHTHPGHSVTPSDIDEETFATSFGDCDWAVMFILARTGDTFARLRFQVGPGGSLSIPVVVDWAAWPEMADHGDGRCVTAWQNEFQRNIRPVADCYHPQSWGAQPLRRDPR